MRWLALALAILLTWDYFVAAPGQSAVERAYSAIASTGVARSLGERLHDHRLGFDRSPTDDYGYSGYDARAGAEYGGESEFSNLFVNPSCDTNYDLPQQTVDGGDPRGDPQSIALVPLPE